MLELLQKTLLYIEEQNEWLSYIQSTIQEKEQHYKSLHSTINKEILKHIRKQDVVDSDDVKMEQDEVVVKEEYCDATDIEVTPIINFQEPSEATSNVDDGTSIDQLEIYEDLNHVVTEEDKEHWNEDGIDGSSFVSTNHHLVEYNINSSSEKAISLINKTSDKYIKVDKQSEKLSIKEKSNRFQCGYCSKTFLHKSHLKMHTRIHTGEKPHKCKYCEKSFKLTTNLKAHLRTHTGETSYNCIYCEKSFTLLINQINHLRTHTVENPYKCEYCEKSFSHTGNLNRHLRTHTGEKPYKCEYCEKSFCDTSNRTKHIRTHTGEKPYKCEYCEKSFSLRFNRNKHLRIHTGEKIVY